MDPRPVFEANIANDLRVPLGRIDLAEVLGNLLENAVRHAAGRVCIEAAQGVAGPRVTIEDDGKGIDPTQLSCVFERGTRLDERGGSASLGLAIVQDVLDAYGWKLDLAVSVPGGVKVTVSPAGVV